MPGEGLGQARPGLAVLRDEKPRIALLKYCVVQGSEQAHLTLLLRVRVRPQREELGWPSFFCDIQQPSRAHGRTRQSAGSHERSREVSKEASNYVCLTANKTFAASL